jgi:hypothetical protein
MKVKISQFPRVYLHDHYVLDVGVDQVGLDKVGLDKIHRPKAPVCL